MAPKRKFLDKEIEFELICDAEADVYSEEDMKLDDYDDQQLSSPLQQQFMKWGLHSETKQLSDNQLIGGVRGKQQNEITHISEDSLCLEHFHAQLSI
jgi:hypothetical protein